MGLDERTSMLGRHNQSAFVFKHILLQVKTSSFCDKPYDKCRAIISSIQIIAYSLGLQILVDFTQRSSFVRRILDRLHDHVDVAERWFLRFASAACLFHTVRGAGQLLITLRLAIRRHWRRCRLWRGDHRSTVAIAARVVDQRGPTATCLHFAHIGRHW